MPLVAELKRRNVFRVAAAYLVVGWLLTEVLTTILPTLGAPEWAARAVILIFAFGFIPAVVFSWFYELTPEGIKRDEDVSHDDAIVRGAARKLDYVTVTGVVILIVFIGLFSAQQTGNDSVPVEAEVSDASVAVLPFENMSNDKDNEYFSDGLTETLLHMLAQVPELKVAARTSSFSFKGQNLNIRQIATALGVAHVLEGSVQRQGDRVRITAQLIRASDGFHVWSESYDRTLDDIFGIQDEIAIRVGNALTESLLDSGERQVAGVNTADPDAYDLYLQARKASATFSFAGLQAAEDLLKGALLIDPDFLDAKTELASTYNRQFETGLMDPQTAFTQILAITGQVLEQRPDDKIALATQMYVNALMAGMAGDISGLENIVPQLEEIVAAMPDEIHPLILLTRTYEGLQQREKVVTVLEEALQRDPYNAQILYELGTAYIHADRPDDAREVLLKSVEFEPDQPNALSYLGAISLQQGDGVGYARYQLKALELDPKDHEMHGVLAAFLYQLKLVEQGDDLRAGVLALAPTSEIAYRIELLRAIATNDTEAGLASARRAVTDHIEERRFAWGGAVQYLLRHAVESDMVSEEMAWLEEQEPGIFELEAESVSMKHRIAQGLALSAWYTTLPRNEVQRRLDTLINILATQGFDPMQDPDTYASILVMRGEIEKAVDIALERIFTQSVAANLGWRSNFSQPHFVEFAADPRIQAAMQRWEKEEEQLRSDVQAYLADLQNSS
jgi:TolB-like protein/thioredoxin-like negative regulator of GroEL